MENGLEEEGKREHREIAQVLSGIGMKGQGSFIYWLGPCWKQVGHASWELMRVGSRQRELDERYRQGRRNNPGTTMQDYNRGKPL